MHDSSLARLLAFALLAATSGCGGYATARQLERGNMGPAACDARCRELGLRMGALALVDSDHVGCVCLPAEAPAVPPPPAPVQPAPPAAPDAPAVPDAPAPPPAPTGAMTPAETRATTAATLAMTGVLASEQQPATKQQQPASPRALPFR